MNVMTETATAAAPEVIPAVEDIQKSWHELTLRIAQLETERAAIEQENKSLRQLLERVIEHRQKSHNELVLILTGLVTKLPLNDVGGIVARLVEHNNSVSQTLASLVKGAADTTIDQPAVLKNLDQTKRELKAALKPAVDELIALDSPLERELLESLAAEPDRLFTQPVIRATRCFIKGQVPRERIVRQFGDAALMFFADLTTDPKLNPTPKPDEIVLAFRPDFEALFAQHQEFPPDKRGPLWALYQRVQLSKGNGPEARLQRNALQKLSFIIDLLHYYENQATEAPDVIFAQRLPALVEQLVVSGPSEPLDARLIVQAEALLGHIMNPDHRLMVINNIGKSGGAGRTLRFVLRFRQDKVPEVESVVEFIKHLLPPGLQQAPPAAPIVATLKLINPDTQLFIAKAMVTSDRLRRDDAEALAKQVAAGLELKGFEQSLKAQESVPVEIERKLAWDRVKDMISRRSDPAAVAAAMRERLHAKYDPDEIRQSWITLTESDPMSLIRIVCQLPYLPSGKTDPIARTVLETYVTRLLHEKYAATYQKVVNSLRNMFHAKPDSPTLLNFTALVRWVSPEASNRLQADIGMPVPA
jgi:hypothetical protein